jgi:predicted transcriptional regulator
MDSKIGSGDWGAELSQEQRAGIERGLNDLDNGRFVPHSDVKRKYGL